MSDVVIVGGGAMGLLTAYELRRRGLGVMLLERDQPGRQASWAAGILSKTVGRRGVDPHADLRACSMERYPPLVAGLREETGLEVQYTLNGIVVAARARDEADALRYEARALRALGNEVEYVEGAALREAEPALGPTVLAGLLEPGGQVDNRLLTRALELACRGRGVEIRTGAAVTEVLADGGRVRGLRTVLGDVAAETVVIAAGSWSGQLRGCEPTLPVVPQRGQILALGRRDAGPRRVVLTFDGPYFVPRPDGRVIVGATRELVGYEASLTPRGVAWLLEWALEVLPGLADAPIVELWTGFRPLSADGLPSIGPSDVEGLWYIAGHGPSGIAPLPGSVALLVALMLGEPPPLPPEPYDPRRFARRSNAADLDG